MDEKSKHVHHCIAVWALYNMRECLFECERWWSACGSTGTGLRAGVLLRPAAVPGHTATLCQCCPLFNTPTFPSPSVFPYVSLVLASFPSNLLISQCTSHLSLNLQSFPSTCFPPLFTSSPPTPKGSKSHSRLQMLLHLHFLSVPKPHQMSWGHSVSSFPAINILVHDLLLIGQWCFFNPWRKSFLTFSSRF